MPEIKPACHIDPKALLGLQSSAVQGDCAWVSKNGSHTTVSLYHGEDVCALVDRIERLEEAARAVLAARDSDCERTGHPGHCHQVPGHWDGDGSTCDHCAAYDDLAVLCGKA